MAVPTFKAWTTAGVAGPATVVNPTTLSGVVVPTHAAGDLLLLITSSRSITATVATPGGWTIWPGAPWRSGTASGGSIYIFYKFAASGSETIPSVTWTGVATGTSGDSSAATAASYTGVNTTTPSDQTAVSGEGSAANAIIPTITTVTPNATVLGTSIKISDTAQTATIANSFTERNDGHTTSGTGHHRLCADRNLATPAATGASTVTQSSGTAARYLGVAIALKPAPSITSVARISLASATTPDTRTLHSIKLRARKASGTGTVLLNAALYESSNNRSGDLASSALTTSIAGYTLSIPDASAANITDYSDLELRLWGSAVSGDVVNVEVAEAWLEIPAGAAGTAWDPGTQADALGVTDSPSFVIGRAITQPDALAVTDVPLTVGVFNIDTLADALGVTDARAHARGLGQADPLGLTDLPTTESGKSASLADPLAATDLTALDRGLSQADALGIADTNSTAGVYVRTQPDALGVTDATAAGLAFDRTVPDLLGLTDTQTFVATFARTVPDLLGITDAATSAAVLERTIPDLLGLTDATSSQAVFERTVTDLLGITDLPALAPALALADPLGLTDLMVPVAVLARTQDDPLGLTDLATPESSGGLVIPDALGITDATALAAATQRSLADNLGLSDAQTLEVGLYRTLADLLGVTDLTAAEKILVAAVADTLGITDTQTFVRGYGLAQADQLALTDQLALAAAFVRALADALGLTDLALPATLGAGPPTESHPDLNGDILTGTATGGSFDESLTGGIPFGR